MSLFFKRNLLISGVFSLLCAVQAVEQNPDIPSMVHKPGVLPKLTKVKPGCSPDKPFVWGHYVTWHNAYNNYVRSESYYDFSLPHDPDLLTSCKREIALAQAAGVNGFFFDLGERYGIREMEPFFKAAEGTDFLIGLTPDIKFKGDKFVARAIELITMYVENFGNHPNCAKFGNKYIIQTFAGHRYSPADRAKLHKELAKKNIEIYEIMDAEGLGRARLSKRPGKLTYGDVVGTYYHFTGSNYAWNPDGEPADAHRQLFEMHRKVAKTNGAFPMISVHPGYTGNWMGRWGNTGYIPARGFDKLWDCFSHVKPGEAKWAHITTWNDYGETAVYPRLFDPGSSLELIRAFTDAKLRLLPPPEQSEPKLYFAMLRESFAGAAVRLEAVTAPIAGKGKVKISGKILCNNGKEVGTIPSKELNINEFDRCDWMIPTAELSKYHALIPEITIQYKNPEGKDIVQTRRLPAVLLRTPWIQNQYTVRSPFHALADIKSDLSLSQKDGLLKAKLKFASNEKVIRAILLRNDRAIAEFRPEFGNASAINIEVRPNIKRAMEIRLVNAKMDGVIRKFGFDFQMEVPWTPDGVKIAAGATGGRYLQIHLLCGKDARIQFLENGKVAAEYTPAEIVAKNNIALPDNLGRVVHRENHCFSPVNPGTLPQEMELALNSRPAHENDIFQVVFVTESGDMDYSPFAAPFSKGGTVKLRLQKTPVNWDWRPNNNGYLDMKEFPEISSGIYDVNTLCLRSGLWDFDNGGTDKLGDRPLIHNDFAPMIKNEGVNGSPCLILSKNSVVQMSWNAHPMATCTIEFKLFIAKLPEKNQTFIQTRNNHRDGFNFTLTPNGKIIAKRDCKGNPSVSSTDSVSAGKWQTVKFVFDEISAGISIDGGVMKKVSMPLLRSAGGMSVLKLGNTTGFEGKLDDLRFSGIAE